MIQLESVESLLYVTDEDSDQSFVAWKKKGCPPPATDEQSATPLPNSSAQPKVGYAMLFVMRVGVIKGSDWLIRGVSVLFDVSLQFLQSL